MDSQIYDLFYGIFCNMGKYTHTKKYAYVILVEYSKYQWRKLAWITLWEELFVYFYETLQNKPKKPNI